VGLIVAGPIDCHCCGGHWRRFDFDRPSTVARIEDPRIEGTTILNIEKSWVLVLLSNLDDSREWFVGFSHGCSGWRSCSW
jgi:hypothetical protein